MIVARRVKIIFFLLNTVWRLPVSVAMSADDNGERSAPSPFARGPLASGTPNRTFTPCRTVGLKRKSAGTPLLHPNAIKRTIVAVEAKKRIGFEDDERAAELSMAKDESIPKSDGGSEAERRSRVAQKRREIEGLKSELRNSKQHNLNNLQELSNKWLNVCQEALTDLHNQLNKNQSSIVYSMEDLIVNLGIDPDLIHFDSNTQEFNN